MSNISSVQGGQTTLLSTIPVDCVPFGMMNYVDKGNHLMNIYNDALDDLDIDIVSGEDGKYIDFNNQDWCITLAFHITKSIIPIEKTKMKQIGNQFKGTNGSPMTPPLTNIEEQQKKEKPIPESKDIQELNLLSQ
jgi:hypothetical protein